MGESHSQPPLKNRRRCPIAAGFHMTECDGLGPGPSTAGRAPVNSVPTLEVATSEQLSSLNIPQTTLPTVAAVALTTSTNNAANPTNLPEQTASLPAAKPDPTNLVVLPSKTQPAPNSRGAASPALPAASEDGKSVGMPRTLKTSLSPTSEYASAVSGTDQTSMPPSMIPTTAPAILTALGSTHNAHPASQRTGYGRTHNSSVTARVSGGISSVGFMGNGMSGQKLSTASNITANMTTPSRPPVIVFSTSLFPVGITATPSARISSSSNAGGLQFRGDGSRFRGLELIRLLGCLTVCMMVGARIFIWRDHHLTCINILHGILMDITDSMGGVRDYLALQGATDEVLVDQKYNE